ncbi:MAG: conjugal transfer protein [Mycobacteriales bacterium]
MPFQPVHRPGSAVPAHPGHGIPMPVSARPTSAPGQYGWPVSAPTGPTSGPYPPAHQGVPGSAPPPGYPPMGGPGGFNGPGGGPGGYPGGYGPPQPAAGSGVFAPQQRYPEPPEPAAQHAKKKKKKRSLWDAFMGDLGKNGRNRDRDDDATVPARRESSGGGSGPLGAYGSLDNRLAMSAGVLTQQTPGFRVEDGVVVPDGARLKKARRQGPGMGGGRWQRFAFLSAMVTAMALLMVLGVTRLANPTSQESAAPGSDFPREAASGYVERLNKVFFTWDTDGGLTRQQLLEVYFPNSRDTRLGWNGQGKQEVRDLPVTLGINVAEAPDAKSAVLRATVIVGMSVVTGSGAPEEKTSFVCTATSVVSDSGALAIDSYPAPVACPKPADVGVTEEDMERDADSEEAIKAQLERFFRAYAASDDGALSNLTTGSDRITTGLGDVRQFGEIEVAVALPAKGAPGNERKVRAAVKWLQPGGGGSADSEYRVTVRQDGGVWRIEKLEPALSSSELQPNLDAQDRKDRRSANNSSRAPSTTAPSTGASGGSKQSGSPGGGP